MIAWLHGHPVNLGDDHVVLNVQGVGYELHCSQLTLDHVRERSDVHLHVYTHVREDVLQLFGFADVREKTLFLNLIKVNGVGPKSALAILSASTWPKIVELIENGDVKGLSSLPKIGKKTAEQIVLTLKGKLVFAEAARSPDQPMPVREEIVSALLHLGFKLADIEAVVDRLEAGVDVEQGVRVSLTQLSQI